jgi:acetolactate synthase I/II/III large subunit
LRAALYWAEFLRNAGVTRLFGHPGTESIELIHAAHEAGLEFVLTHHEATAGFAASMTGRLTGIPGVCLTTAGPGATNIASAVAQAHLDRMPMLAFTGDHPMGPAQPLHQRLPPDLYGPIARATVRLSAETLPAEMPRALAMAVRYPPGPVYVTFPSDQMSLEVAPTGLPDLATTIDEEAPAGLEIARQMIEAAARPMIIAGLGIPAARAEDAFRRFAAALRAPVADTPQGRGSFPTDDPRYVGTFATHRDATVASVANASDLIVAVGLDSVEFLKPWQLQPPVLVLASGSGAPDPAIPAKHVVSGAIGVILTDLAQVQPGGNWDVEEIEPHKEPGAFQPAASAEDGALSPQAVVDALSDALAPEAIVTVDVGSHKLLMVQRWTVREPATFLNSSGISSMGTGLPFAVAAKLVHPERQVVAVIGDGGFLMYAGEMATLARMGLSIVVVVMSDSALYSIKIKQLRRSYPPIGTDFPGVRVAAIARAFGVHGEEVGTLDAIRHAIARALERDGPTVIEASIDPAGYELTQ